MLNKKGKKNGVIVVLIMIAGLLLLVFGVVLAIIDIDKEFGQPVDKKPIVNQEEDEYPPEVLENIITNDSKKLAKKHCLDNFCVTYMNINYMKESFGAIYTELKNIGKETISAGFVNMEFETPSGTIVLFMYHPEILPGGKTRVGTNFLDEAIAYADDYKLTQPTPEQLQEYEKMLVY